MGTTSSTASSTTSTPGFNGSSTYATQLQSAITRAVQLASLPMTQLQNEEGTLTSQQSELQTLGNDFQSVQTAIGSIDSATSSSLAPTVSDGTVLSADVSTGALAGSYSVDITNLGGQTNTISNSTLPAVADPSSGNISSSSTFTLTVNGANYSLSPASNTLNSLVSAINASGANVQATVVNVGGSTSPNYELSIQGTQYAPTTIQLNDGTQNLLTTLSAGSYVQYQVNGQPSTPATSTSRTLDISTGLTVNAQATGTATVTVAQSGTNVENAISSFVTAYNAAVDEVTKNRGQNGGALAGQSVLDGLSNTLLNLANYNGSGSGNITNLTDLGLTFDQSGHLDFDASTFESAASSSLDNVMSFLGSVSGNTGFLGAANSALNSVTDPTSGLIVSETNSLGTSITNLQSQISADQTYVNNLQSSITAQMASADAAIASLQSQDSQITSLFTAEQDNALSIANG